MNGDFNDPDFEDSARKFRRVQTSIETQTKRPPKPSQNQGPFPFLIKKQRHKATK